jgi:GT2 family glycosyltransferase
MEEVDLSYRILDAGYRIVYAPDAAVIHHRVDAGRPIKGADYWARNTLNKARMAWRLLPLPFPITILIIWSAAALIKTRRIDLVWHIWRQLWAERSLLAQERKPLQQRTLEYLRNTGARLLY